MDIKQLIKDGKRYNEIEMDYILDALNSNSRISVYDMNEQAYFRVFTCRVDSSITNQGYIYVKKLDADGKPVGQEYKVETGYYISGCEYPELTI